MKIDSPIDSHSQLPVFLYILVSHRQPVCASLCSSRENAVVCLIGHVLVAQTKQISCCIYYQLLLTHYKT